jgi:hypothetical protein
MTATPNAYNIYYGNFSSTYGQTFISLVDYFTQNLGGSSWWNMNTAYYQIIDGVQTFCPNSLQWVKSINLRSNYSTQALTESDIINDLTAAISAGLLPVDENGIYSVMFAGSLSVTVNGRQKNWCGFHSAFYYANTVLKYQLVGDPSSSTIFPNRCAAIIDDSSSANGHWGADSAVNFFAHEATEIVTNYDGAWSSQGVENADFCTLRFGAPLDPELNNANIVIGQKKFLVQENWVPNYGCSISNPFSTQTTLIPSFLPSQIPTIEVIVPSFKPSKLPTRRPSKIPTSKSPIIPTQIPSLKPSKKPTLRPSKKAPNDSVVF